MTSYKGSEGAYTLMEKIGAGGNGEVWRAKGPRSEVAIKILKNARRAPADAAPRFDREISALRKLSDVPGVLPLLDADSGPASSHQPWFAMPLAITLREKLGTDATLKYICEACADLAAALSRVHERRVVHRDIKPDNLYWYGDAWCLGDFGLADFPDAVDLTESGKKLGPAFYIAPEMLNHAASADGRMADVYSLGKTIWVLATGQNYPMPGVHDPGYAAGAISTYREDPRSGLLDELVRRMTLNDPAKRPTAAEVARELALLSRDKTMDQPPDPATSLNRLRAALVPHFTREQEEARQAELAEATADEIRQVIEEIANIIQTTTGLSPADWYDVPKYWGYRAHMAGPSIEAEESSGFSFEAGGEWHTWRLSIGVKHQLLSNGTLVLHVGYHFDYMINGHDANHMGMPRGWAEKGEASNGTPSAQALAEHLISGLKANLPDVVNRYAQLVEQASQ